MATYQLANFGAKVSGVTYQLADLGTIAGGVSYQLADLEAVAGQDFTVSLGLDLSYAPFDTGTLTASSVLVADSWVFVQIDGPGGSVISPTVTLAGSGGIRTYRCPGRLTEQTLFFRCTATKDGSTSVAEVKHTIAPHAGRFGPGGVGWQRHLT